MTLLKPLEFEVRDNPYPCRGRVWVSLESLEEMYRSSKYQWENRSDWHGDEYWCDRVHTLEAMVQKAREGKYIFMKTGKH